MGVPITHVAFEYSAESYRASAGFSSLMGKNNWYYQQWKDPEYTDLRFTPDLMHPKMWWFGDGGGKVGVNYQIAGDSDIARRWIAPHGGTVRVEGHVQMDEADSSISVSIFLNSQKIWPDNATPGQIATHNMQVTVIQGDSIAFVVAKAKSASASAAPESSKVTWIRSSLTQKASPQCGRGIRRARGTSRKISMLVQRFWFRVIVPSMLWTVI